MNSEVNFSALLENTFQNKNLEFIIFELKRELKNQIIYNNRLKKIITDQKLKLKRISTRRKYLRSPAE